MKKIVPSVSLLLFVFFSCNPNKDTSTEYLNFNLGKHYWKSNKITHFVGNISYSATEVPLEYYLNKASDNNPIKIDSISKEHSKNRIIEFEFQHIKDIDLLESKYTHKSYDESVKYMAFETEHDFMAVTSNNDTILCAGVHFERNFKITPYKKILLYFNDIDPNENLQLVYNDQLFGNGLFKFNFQDVPLKL